MNFETLFWISTFINMPFWFLMIWLPNWSWTKRIVTSPVILLPISVIYCVTTIPIFDSTIAAFLNPSLAGLAEALSNPANAVATWQHLLAFDLAAGYWAFSDGYGRNVNRWLMTISLITILMLGPLGFVIYLGVRTFAGNRA